jgi:hypothetical protein
VQGFGDPNIVRYFVKEKARGFHSEISLGEEYILCIPFLGEIKQQ